MFILSASVLIAKYISRFSGRSRVLSIVVSALILIEFLSIPLELSETTVPSFYESVQQDGGDYVIMGVPISPVRFKQGNSTWENGLPHYMFYQTVHGKKTIGGYVSYPTQEATDFISDNIFLRAMNDLGSEVNESIEYIIEVGVETLEKNDVRYVVVHKGVFSDIGWYEGDALEKTLDVVSAVTGEGGVVFEDETIVVYERGDERV